MTNELRFPLYGISVYQMPVPRISIQRRKHRKKRIDKKWRKRYGFISIPDPSIDQSVILMDKERRCVYCYPAGYAAILKHIPELNTSLNSPPPRQEPVTYESMMRDMETIHRASEKWPVRSSGLVWPAYLTRDMFGYNRTMTS